MKKKERQFLILILVVQVLIFAGMIFFAIRMTNSVSESSKKMLNEQAMKNSEFQMRERVENIINYIEHERTIVMEGVQSLGDTVYQNLENQEEEYLELYMGVWMPKIAQMQHGQMMQLILHNKEKNQYAFYSNEGIQYIPQDVPASEIEEYINKAPYSNKIEYQNKILYILVPQENMDQRVKEHIYDMIHISVYGEDGYVWVNEIVNYDGGENYAIRRIHPNLIDTEGQYLSTDMQDAVGNYPYLNELEEIKKYGEVFHTYYFKNKSNDVICEKASYAKLYESYNWIIATGNPLDDVLQNSMELNEQNQMALSGMLFEIIISLIVIFIIDIVVILINNKKIKEIVRLEEKISHDEEKVKQADFDTMTGLLRRGVGEYKIKEHLKTYAHKKNLLIAVDLDGLKKINDTLGHSAGDEAIIGIANVIKSSFREKDILMRYGGDEFVIFITNEVEPIDIVTNRMKTLVNKVESIYIGENKEYNIHCSVGCAVSENGDTFDTLFARADKALYHVKRNGKNNFAVYTPEMEEEFKNKHV